MLGNRDSAMSLNALGYFGIDDSNHLVRIC